MNIDNYIRAVFALAFGIIIVTFIAGIMLVFEIANNGGLATSMGNWVQQFEEARSLE